MRIEIKTKGNLLAPIQCWGCGGNHMFKYYPEGNMKPRNIHNNEEETTTRDVARSTHRICVALYNRQEDHQSNIVEMEGKIGNQPLSILIDPRVSLSYVTLKIVEVRALKKSKHKKGFLV